MEILHIDENTPIGALTVGQFAKIFLDLTIENNPKDRKTLHSIRELAEFIGCSLPTAHAYKNSGKIPYLQIGRKIMFDTEDVLNSMNINKKFTK